MGKSQETFSKKEKEKKRRKKRQDKQQKREERQANSAGGGLDNMIAYVNHLGEIVDTPPEPPAKEEEVIAEDIIIGIPAKGEYEEEETVKKGRVDFFNHEKGFGFIKQAESNESFFVHINNAYEEITENHKVTFETEKSPKGMAAVKVKKAE